LNLFLHAHTGDSNSRLHQNPIYPNWLLDVLDSLFPKIFIAKSQLVFDLVIGCSRYADSSSLG
jgi:hypothetical protein